MLNNFLIYASIISPVIGITLGLKKGLMYNPLLRFIVVLMVVSFLADLTMLLMAKNGIPNMPISNIYGLLEGILLFLFFRLQLKEFTPVIIVLLISFVSFHIIDTIFYTNIYDFNAYSKSLEAVLMIVLSIMFFYKVFVNETNIFIEKNPDFLIVIGVFFYFSIAFFSFMLSSDILSQSPDRFYGSWIIHNIANILKNILFTLALWKAAKR